MINVRIEIDCPDAELEPLLQALRKWEGGREAILLQVRVQAETMPTASVLQIIKRLDPPPAMVTVVPREGGGHG